MMLPSPPRRLRRAQLHHRLDNDAQGATLDLPRSPIALTGTRHALMPKKAERHSESASRRRPRWQRLTLRTVFVSILLIVLAGVIITRTNVLGIVVLPRISKIVGCNASAGRVTLNRSGQIVIRDLQLRAPALPGQAGQFLQAKEIALTPRWLSLLTGSLQISHLTLHQPTIRLSQDEQFNLNVASLRAPARQAPGSFQR